MERTHQVSRHHTRLIISAQMPMFLLRRVRSRLAQTRSQQAGRACPLCPGTSDLNLLRYRERVIDLNAQISPEIRQ